MSSAGEPNATRADLETHLYPDRGARPGVEAFRLWVLRCLGGTDLGIWGDASHSSASDHYVGRAWDWGAPSSADVERLLVTLLEDDAELARRLGLLYVITAGHILAAYEGPWTARPYEGADPHDTHAHFSFTDLGAMGQTSGYASMPAACPSRMRWWAWVIAGVGIAGAGTVVWLERERIARALR